MSGKPSSKDRAGIIRKGNEFFNLKQYEKAAKLFWHADYYDGLNRIGEFLLYEEQKPFQALLYFKKTKNQHKIHEIIGRMLFALRTMVKKN